MSRKGLFETIATCRQFFNDRDFLETPTPPMVSNPGMEAHLHPFQIKSLREQKELELFLHTSPEFHMKELLSEGFEKIYNITWCFRDEPSSQTHRNQFLMLEWYRANSHYDEILKDTLDLILYTHKRLKSLSYPTLEKVEVSKTTVQELFLKYLKLDILKFLDVEQIEEYILKNHSDLLKERPKQPWPWEDYFFLLFLNKIEPHFKEYPCLVVDEFPAPLAALSTIKKDDPRVCERFEIYLQGIELCNCFNELTNLEEQKERMIEESKKKKLLYGYELPQPEVLFSALEKGLPPSAGIALGVERLYMGLMQKPQKSTPFFNPE